MSQTEFTDKGLVSIDDNLTDLERRRRHRSVAKIQKFSNIRAVCPYCLYFGTLDEFKSLTRAHIVAQRLKCPSCNEKMSKKLSEYFDNVSREEYSEWFWKEIYFFKGYERMDLDNVISIVKDLEFTEPFWEAQKKMQLMKHGVDE